MSDVKKTWYVYLLCDPDTEQPFYIGKGTGNRIDQHEARLNSRLERNAAKKEVIRKILAQGKQVLKKKVAEFDNEAEAYLYEKALIKAYESHLTNIRPGVGSCSGNQRVLVSASSTKGYVTLDVAYKRLNWSRMKLYDVIKELDLPIYKFKLDRKSYLSQAQVKQLKELKEKPWLAGSRGEQS